MADPIRRKVLGDLVQTRLGDLAPAITIYRGEIRNPDGTDTPPVIMTGGNPDPSGRVAPYVVLHTGAGNPLIEAGLGDCGVELDWSFQTTVVAGYDESCGHAADQVHDRLYRWVPVLAGHSFGRVKPPPGFDPGTVQRQDFSGLPPRYFLPLQWRLPLTTS